MSLRTVGEVISKYIEGYIWAIQNENILDWRLSYILVSSVFLFLAALIAMLIWMKILAVLEDWGVLSLVRKIWYFSYTLPKETFNAAENSNHFKVAVKGITKSIFIASVVPHILLLSIWVMLRENIAFLFLFWWVVALGFWILVMISWWFESRARIRRGF